MEIPQHAKIVYTSQSSNRKTNNTEAGANRSASSPFLDPLLTGKKVWLAVHP